MKKSDQIKTSIAVFVLIVLFFVGRAYLKSYFIWNQPPSSLQLFLAIAIAVVIFILLNMKRN